MLLLQPANARQPIAPSSATSRPDESLVRAHALAPLVIIARDEWGVAHVQAPTDAGAVFGGMYARAEDEMSRIEKSYAQMIGLASLWHGEAGVSWDRLVLSFEVPDRAKRACEDAPVAVRSLAQAAADALNLYLDAHREYSPRAIPHWEAWMFFASEYSWALYQAQEEARRMLDEIDVNPEALPDALPDAAITRPASTPSIAPTAPDGSNGWAIGPSRIAGGHALLYINPHIPLDEPYELHLRSDEGLNISGFVAYGADILPSAGFNQHLGWTLTVNYVDIADTYAIRFDVPNDALAYRHGDAVKHATVRHATIPVRRADGTIEQRDLTLAKTHHGPIVYSRGNVSYAIRASRMEDLRALEQWYAMAKATNLAEWKRAVAINSVVFHNLVYADDAGNIGYIYNAAFPRRDPQFDWTTNIDGNDPRTDWLGYHTLDEIPQVWNPACGYVLNCNSSPLTTAAEGENPDASRFPAYMFGRDLADGRVAMSHEALSQAKDWTLDDLERAAFDTTVHSERASRQSLIAAFGKLQKDSPEKTVRIAPAIDLLREWDGRLALDSIAATLYCEWIERLFSEGWRDKRAPEDLCNALAETMDDLQRRFGDWRIAWGEINRHQRFDSNADVAVSDERESLPIAGGHGGMGVGFCYLSRAAAGNKHRYGYHGHSYVAAVEFVPSGSPRARSVIPFGQSRDPKSPHYADQMTLYVAGRMKPALFSDTDVRARAARTYHPGE